MGKKFSKQVVREAIWKQKVLDRLKNIEDNYVKKEAVAAMLRFGATVEEVFAKVTVAVVIGVMSTLVIGAIYLAILFFSK